MLRKNLEARIPDRCLKFLRFRLPPRASVFVRGRLVAVVSLVSDIYPLSRIGKFGGGGYFGKSEPERLQEILETLTPWRRLTFPASACFRVIPSSPAAARQRWFRGFRLNILYRALVNSWAMWEFRKMGNRKAPKTPENADTREGLKFLASVCFCGLPSASV